MAAKSKGRGSAGKDSPEKGGEGRRNRGEVVSPTDTALCGWHPLESHTRQACDTDRQCETARCKWADKLTQTIVRKPVFSCYIGNGGSEEKSGTARRSPSSSLSLSPPWGGSPPHLALRAEEDTGGVPLPGYWQPLEAPCVP